MKLLCHILGHKVPRSRRFFLTERRARCKRCGRRVRLREGRRAG